MRLKDWNAALSAAFAEPFAKQVVPFPLGAGAALLCLEAP